MRIINLQRGRTRLTIMPELGGRIAQIEVFDGATWLPLLCESTNMAPEQRDPLSWGSFAMLPWPNRITAGRFAFEGVTYQLPLSDSSGALHGLGFARQWTVDQTGDDECDLSLDIGTDIWPWRGACCQRFAVLDDGVRQTIEIRAAAGERFPAACGWHPWFRRDVFPGSDVRVKVDAAQRFELAFDRIPNGRLVPVDGEYDLRRYPRLGDRRLDDCYRHPRGPLRISWGGMELTMTSSPNVTHIVIYTPARGVCVEPQTCAIDAFNLEGRGTEAGMVTVDDASPLIATTEWRWSMK